MVVSEAISLTFHGFDFVVDAFQRSGGDGVVVVGQETVGVKAKRSGKLMKNADASRFCAENPIQQKRFGFLLAVLLPEFAQLTPKCRATS